MDIMTLAMAKPKVIDLDSYGIGFAILYLFANGGGTQELKVVGTFWDDIATNRPLQLVQDYDDVTFVIDQSVRIRMNNDPNNITMLSFSFMAAESTNAVYTIHVAIINTFNGGAAVVVKVA